MSLQNTGPSDRELALVVRPKVAMAMLDISAPTFYGLISAGLIDSYKEGAARKVVVKSIRKYIADRVAASATKVPQSSPRRAAARSTPPRRTAEKLLDVSGT
jgi:hypothetical protein